MQKLCCVRTKQNLEICPNFANPYLTQFSSISGGNCIKRATISEHVKDQDRFKLKIDGDQLDDLNPNHVNESLLSEVDWGDHNLDADDPEQLTGESIQSFLTFVVQLQWLVALGDLSPMHKSLPCPSLWWHHLDLKTNIYGYINIFPRQPSFKFPSSTHTHTHTNYIYIYILLCMSAQEHVRSTTRGE